MMQAEAIKKNASRKRQRRIATAIVFALLCLVGVTMLFPVYWMITSSLKTRKNAMAVPPQWWPAPFDFGSYTEIWEVAPLLSGIGNSALQAAPILLFGTLSSVMAAFAFSKMEMPAKSFLFMTILSSMMIPSAVTIIPQYVTWGKLRLINTLWPIIIPGCFGNVGMMFFLRQFMNGIANDYIDAAKLDGAGWFKILFSIFLPMIKTAMAVQVVFWFIGIWNDFLGPLIYLDSENKMTIQIALRYLSASQGQNSRYNLIMAGSVVSMVPLLTLYLCFQKYFLESIGIAGIKG